MQPQRMTIHQFHFSVRDHDAVTNHMRLIRETLHKAGIGGEIFAWESPAFPKDIALFARERIWNCDLLLIHHSHGNPALNTLLSVEVPKALVYHNVTPMEFFPHDPYIAGLCRLGRAQLQTLKKHVVVAFGDSEYNVSELKSLGFSEPVIFPLLDLSESVTEPMPPLEDLRLLFVGRLSPHKNQALLIKTLYYLKAASACPVHLTLVGGGDKLYSNYLRLLTRCLGLEKQVHFRSEITPSELSGIYRSSTAFFCASLHEGFCIPLVEAMLSGLTVFAFASEGVKGTLGKSGLKFDTLAPHEVARFILECRKDETRLRENHLAQAGRLNELRQIHHQKRITDLLTARILKLRSEYRKKGNAVSYSPPPQLSH